MDVANLAFLRIDPVRLVPMVGNLLVGIMKMAQEISIKVEDVKAHKRQCSRLSARINRVAAHLNSDKFKKLINSYDSELEQTLNSFHAFLHECLQYISLFVDMGWIKMFINSREHKEHFQDLNEQLELFFGELSMGINIKNLIDKKQDEQDRTEDSKGLQSLFNGLKPPNEPKSRSKSSSPMKNRRAVPGMRDIGFILSSGSPDNSPVSSSNNIFMNGIWSLRYSQYGSLHGPFKQHMTFNSNNSRLEGKGENDVGQFILEGTFSKDTNSINIIQTYKYGTGNPLLNAGHQCRYQLTWNKDKRVFEGINYMPNGWTRVRTPVGGIEMSMVAAA
jgi:hypothetical protein